MRLKNYLKESYGSPRVGHVVMYNGRKLTIKRVGSGMGWDKYLTIRFEGENHDRDIKMTDFFKPQNKIKLIKEGYTTRSLMSHIPPAWVSKKVLKVGDRKKINKDIQVLLKPTYFKSIPLEKIFKILEKYGIVALQEDNTEWSGFLMGGVKDTEMVNFNLGWKNENRDDRGVNRYMAVPNSVLTMTFYKMPQSGNFEVVAYVS